MVSSSMSLVANMPSTTTSTASTLDLPPKTMTRPGIPSCDVSGPILSHVTKPKLNTICSRPLQCDSRRTGESGRIDGKPCGAGGRRISRKSWCLPRTSLRGRKLIEKYIDCQVLTLRRDKCDSIYTGGITTPTLPKRSMNISAAISVFHPRRTLFMSPFENILC